MFKKAFPKQKRPFTYKNIGHAIAAFEKTLITPAKFDDCSGTLTAKQQDTTDVTKDSQLNSKKVSKLFF